MLTRLHCRSVFGGPRKESVSLKEGVEKTKETDGSSYDRYGPLFTRGLEETGLDHSGVFGGPVTNDIHPALLFAWPKHASPKLQVHAHLYLCS